MAQLKALTPGTVLRNRYGLLLTVRRVVKGGVVRVFGDAHNPHTHEGLTEWGELRRYWTLP